MLSDRGSITDVPGIRVGHHHRQSSGWLTGTTVILATDGVTAGVEVRGGGPGTRETDALTPWNLVDRIHAICLTGGSAYGLAAADGVMEQLAARGLGFSVGPQPHHVVPVVPTAVIFDLGRGGRFGARPTAEFGARATRSARASERRRGSVGAGIGAVAGGLRGGVGMASVTVELSNEANETNNPMVTIGALAVVNARGSLIDPSTGLPYVSTDGLRRPSTSDRRALGEHCASTSSPAFNTTLVTIATDASLSRAEATRLAMAGHDGLSHAIRPAHTLADGDTVFSMSTGVVALGETNRPSSLTSLHSAAATCVATACVDAILAAAPRPDRPTYLSLCPSALR